ncbi:TPA: hypothetical protein DCX16_05575 [bacterium]|nr:hypothetical protein [bacterium]
MIILDVMMFGINGYEVCQVIKEDRLKSHISNYNANCQKRGGRQGERVEHSGR